MFKKDLFTLPNKVFSSVVSTAKQTAGFTMIELLVVIAVIGVLAVAVLSSINPIEQINKGRDTRTRSDAAQLINAVDRFFAIHEQYPWNVASDDFTPSDSQYSSEYIYVPGGNLGWLEQLVTTAEVKAGFTNRIQSEDGLYISKIADTNATMYVCFEPTSEAFKFEARQNCGNNQHLDINFGNGARPVCPEEGSTDDPLICLP